VGANNGLQGKTKDKNESETAMRNKHIIITTLAATSLALAATGASGQFEQKPVLPQPAQAGHDSSKSQPAGQMAARSYLQASRIVGHEVFNDQGERLGKVQDLIISLNSERVPVVILEYGGILGMDETHVAVPLRDLKCSGADKLLTLSATRDQLQAASTTATGGWAFVANEDWAKHIDHFYGQPTLAGMNRFERQPMRGMKADHEFVRERTEPNKGSTALGTTDKTDPKANEALAKPDDAALMKQINKLIADALGKTTPDQVKVTVEQGVVTLKGNVADKVQKQNLETRIKALTGVQRVDDQLSIKK
jgi:sporulation protein YlmC with PRC-barrel domain